MDEKSHDPEQDEEEQEDVPRCPSVLAALEEKSDKPEPVVITTRTVMPGE